MLPLESNAFAEAGGRDSNIYLELILQCTRQSNLAMPHACLLSARKAAAVAPAAAVSRGLSGRERCRTAGAQLDATRVSEPPVPCATASLC